MPTHEEIEAIDLITVHVADAIMWFRGEQSVALPVQHQSGAKLKLVYNNQQACDPATRLVALVEKLHSKAGDLDRCADHAESEADAQVLRRAAELSRKLSANIKLQVELARSGKPAR
jgi:hypothetical protein